MKSKPVAILYLQISSQEKWEEFFLSLLLLWIRNSEYSFHGHNSLCFENEINEIHFFMRLSIYQRIGGLNLLFEFPLYLKGTRSLNELTR